MTTYTGKDALVETLRAYNMPATSIAWMNSIDAQTGATAWGVCTDPAWLIAFAYRSASPSNKAGVISKFIEFMEDELDVTTFASEEDEDAFALAINRLTVATNPAEPSRSTLLSIVNNLPQAAAYVRLKRNCQILAMILLRPPVASTVNAILEEFALNMQAQRSDRLRTSAELEKFGTSLVIKTKIPWSSLTDAQDCLNLQRLRLGVDPLSTPLTPVTGSI